MKFIHRVGGMAGLLLLVSMFSTSKASAEVKQPETNLANATIEARIAAIQSRLQSNQQQANPSLTIAQSGYGLPNVQSQWSDWNNWGDWTDWGNWNDWTDWNNWSDWNDWNDLSWSWGDAFQSMGY